MAPIPQRPENVLKRAEELVSVGQQSAALNSLHDLIVSKRSKSAPIASLEPFMLRFVELAVEQRKGKIAKEGLYQYRNIAQNTSVETLVVVVTRFLELSEAKFKEARDKAEQVSLDNIDDLEATETPESILLSTVSNDEAKDRTDRAIVTPWLRFLWEAYRTVLDILRNNGRLEITYQRVSIQALEFCQNHGRKTEFRRLCDLLRNHLQTAAKYQSQAHGINLNDPDTLQRHLDTRFAQLNTAVAMELWQEAFRSVEDIHNLLTIAKRPPKPSTMANYYEKLSKIFLKSGNYLFHAAAFNRYATLVRTQNRNATEAELEHLGSIALLSALAIPVMRDSNPRGVAMDLDDSRNKDARLAALLNMSVPPTRAGLLREALNKGARPRQIVRDLNTVLESKFGPLSLCERVSPLFEQISTDDRTKIYVEPLQQVVLTKLFQQLSRVYETVSFEYVVSLAKFPTAFAIDAAGIEKFIMLGCKRGEFAIRIDHSNDAISFDSDVLEPANMRASDRQVEASVGVRLQPTPAELVRSQLTRLARCLYSSLSHVDPAFCEEKAALKKAALERAAANVEREHEDMVARTKIIERRKELAATARQKREQEEASKRAVLQQREAEAESKRQAEETRRRELERIKREQDKIKAEESKKLVEELKASGTVLDVGDAELGSLDTTKLRIMQLEALEKSTKDVNDRMRVTAKRLDHLERALRRAEIPLVEQAASEQVEVDRANHEEQQRAMLEVSKQKHAEDVATKHRLVRVMADYEDFKEQLYSRRDADFKTRREASLRKLEEEKEKRRQQFRKRRADEAAQKKAEEEQIRREEEQRAQAAERAERAAEERRKLDEQAQRQREREAAAEAKLAARREGRPVPGVAAEHSSAGTDSPAAAAATPPASSAGAGAGAGAAGGVYRPGQGKWSSQRMASGAAGDLPPTSSGRGGPGGAERGPGGLEQRRNSPFGNAAPSAMGGSRQASRESSYMSPAARQGSRDSPFGAAGGAGSRQASRSGLGPAGGAGAESPAPSSGGQDGGDAAAAPAPAAAAGASGGKYVPRHLRPGAGGAGAGAGAGAGGERRSSGW